MKNRYSFFASAFALGFLLIAGTAQAATLYSQTVSLTSGWNIVSTPKVLDSHSFSATENSTNFDIYALDPSKTSGWATLADLGQTEFAPLYGYFINNKTGSTQTLTFNYKSGTQPNERLFSRTFTTTGWYSMGVANPTYAKAQGAATTTDSNNPNNILFSLRNFYSQIVDFTVDAFSSNADSVKVGNTWSAWTYSDGDLANDFRETKAYAIYVNVANGLYSGFQDNTAYACSDGIDNDSDGLIDFSGDPGCSNSNDQDESNIPGALTVSMSSSPATQNVVAGTQALHMANVLLDATQSGENVRISSLKLTQTGTISNLSSCQLFNGSTVLNSGSNVPSTLAASGSDTTFTLDNTLTITKGSVVTLAVKCNLGSATSGTHVWSISGAALSATGVTTGSSIDVAETAGSGGTMTIASPSLAVSVDSSSPSYALVAGGTTGQTMGVIKLRATNEAISLTKLGLTITSGSATDLVQLYIYDGATLVGTATFTGSNTLATSTLSTPVTLPKDTDKTLTIKADLADVGSGQSGTEGQLIKVDPASAEGSGQSSGSTVQSGATAGVTGVRLFNTYPTIVLDTVSSTGIADGRLMRFKVTANSADAVGVGKFTFSVATTTLTVTDVQLIAYTDSSYSSPISGQGTGGQIGSTLSSIPSSSNFVIAPTSAQVAIPAGSTYYFELRGSISGNSTGAAAVTILKGDSAFDGMKQLTDVSGNLVWTPNATTTSSFTTNDWTSAHGVPGLPTSGLTQTRSN